MKVSQICDGDYYEPVEMKIEQHNAVQLRRPYLNMSMARLATSMQVLSATAVSE
jgi:hypothetical protein